MSTTWAEEGLDNIYEEYDDSEAYDDADPYNDEEASRSDRRNRARRVALARARAAQRRDGGVSVSSGGLPANCRPPSAVQRTARAVRELDLETKVAQDSLRGSVGRLDKSVKYAEYSVAASTLVTAALDNLGEPDNRFLVTGIKASPLLLLLASPRRGSGAGAVLTNPAVIGIAGAFGLAFIGNQRDKNSGIKSVTVTGPTTMAVDQKVTFIADVLDGKGKPTNEAVTWTSSDPNVLTIDATTGAATAKAVGFATVSATADGVVGRLVVSVVKATSYTK